MNASIPFGPPINTDIDYYITIRFFFSIFFFFFFFVSSAMLVMHGL